MMMVPLCSYFGSCGGCLYQDRTYETELSLKEKNLRELLGQKLDLGEEVFLPIVPSPHPYGYRSRLDLSFRRRKEGFALGFTSEGTRRLVPIDSCVIARPEVSAFLPTLKRLASERIPATYRSANLVIKTGEEGRLHWGGIGRHSLFLPASEYFWTEIEGKRIFYSLDTFFQANLSILPEAMKTLRRLLDLTLETVLLDLYSGVGLFWMVFAPEVKEVWAVEDNADSVRVAEFNRSYHDLSNVNLKKERTENVLEEILDGLKEERIVAIIDPPRKGLSPGALEKLSRAKCLDSLVYISCHPPSLARDLKGFRDAGWRIATVVPMDFFPRTKHLETLVRLTPGK